jgi:hypothetical protein
MSRCTWVTAWNWISSKFSEIRVGMGRKNPSHFFCAFQGTEANSEDSPFTAGISKYLGSERLNRYLWVPPSVEGQ